MNSAITNKTTRIRTFTSTQPILQHLLADADARVYVDFDYTLFQSNSTEAFLNSGRPAFITAFILRILRVLTPWTFSRHERAEFLWRDAVRIWTVLLTLPWTLWLFRRKAPALFARFQSPELMEMLRHVDLDRVVIVTNGYRYFVEMLLRGSALENATLVGSSLFRPSQVRRVGKLSFLTEQDLAPQPVKDVVITDSMDDEDLLESVDHGYLANPVGLDNHNELAGVYVPFFYSARVKRSPEFVVKQMFLEELPIILLATVFFHPFSLSLWVAATLLFVGFLAAYELGYAENDRIGYLNEARPKLAQDYEQFKDVELQPAAWYWIVALTVSGVWMLGRDMQHATLTRLGIDVGGGAVAEQVALIGLWLVVVAAGRLLFYFYNRMPMVWRVFGYILLHFGKYFSLVVIFSSEPVGYALICAHIIRTWSLYAIRRSGGSMELVASQSIRLAFFILLLVAFVLAAPSGAALLDWHTWVIVAFCLVRAAPEAKRKLFDREALRNGMRRSK